ncbi:hypothetical protein RND71_034584 [Anisodus tanguticus]|uniref:DUF4283 domain-containing protein n=1 Tax=Anisodus tanguticus TaxID=243964 RepID=A0AAE1R9Y5_9SOLA|nr:hypothetical protein RND71_034584 [Anisodus tanguticus]
MPLRFPWFLESPILRKPRSHLVQRDMEIQIFLENSNVVTTEKALNAALNDGTVLDKTKNSNAIINDGALNVVGIGKFMATIPNGTRILTSQPSASNAPIDVSHHPESQTERAFATKVPQQHKDTNASKKTYAGIFTGSRLEAKGIKLQYLEQEGDDVELDATDEVPFVETWGYCLIGCFTGPFPGRVALNSIVKEWVVKCRIIPYGRRWTIFRLVTKEDRIKVFHGGPYMTFGKTLMLKLVDKGVLLNDNLFTNIPVWVVLRDVHLSVCSASGLSKITSRVGIPLYTDKFTKERSKMNYARVLIEIDISKEPVTEFGVKLPDTRRYVQKVEYENYPDYCFNWETFGHNHLKCKKLSQEVEPKEITRPQNLNNKSKNGWDAGNKDVAQGQALVQAFGGGVLNHGRVLTEKTRGDSNMSFVPIERGGAKTIGGVTSMDICELPRVNIEQRAHSTGDSTTLVANTIDDGWQEVISRKNNGKEAKARRGGTYESSFGPK